MRSYRAPFIATQVAYLAITGWLDDRKEKEDRIAFESAEAQR
jgi:hypothetical protein